MMKKSLCLILMMALTWMPVVSVAQDASETSLTPDAPATPSTPDASETPLTPDAASSETSPQTAAADEKTGTTPAQDGSGLPEAEVLTDAMLDKTLYEVRTRVDTLKEDTFTTKSRLLLLREEVLQRSVSGARLLIRHKDDMGGQYELIKVLYVMDNIPAFSRSASDMAAIGDLDDQIIFDGITAPGTHQLTVQYVYRGKKWGVFSYMHNYAFVVESGYSFVVDEGKSAELVVTATERGNFFTPYEERPSISYAFEQYDLATDSDTELRHGAGLSPDTSK